MDRERIVGQYSLGRKIGVGGMAEVWEARHVHLGTRVAIKFLLSRFASEPLLQERFLREGQRQASLKHPNIVEAVDFLLIEGWAYLVMQYIDGGDLDSKLQPGMGPLPMRDVINVSWGVLQALGYAHASRFVHRDVKPSNVLIDRQGKIFLSDFGIALALDDNARLTRTGVALGTPHYMSPEQINAAPELDHRADIYSFGCVLYAMLTGAPPFDWDGASEWQIKHRHMHEPPPPIRAKHPAVTPAMEHIALKCMAKLPASRYQTCNEVLWAMHSALGGTGAYIAPMPGMVRPQGQAPTVLEGRRMTTVVPAEQLQQAVQTLPFQTPAPPPEPAPRARKRGKWLPAAMAVALVAALGLGAYAYVARQRGEPAFRMEGSTTIGDALAPALVQAFLNKENAKEVETIAGKDINKDLLTFRAIMPGFSKASNITIRVDGSGRGFDALKDRTADVGMAARRIDGQESGSLANVFHENMTVAPAENVVALDGIAMVVNPANPVAVVTRQQLAAIYDGAITNWNYFNGPDLEIKLYGREQKSEMYDAFVELVMRGKAAGLSPRIDVQGDGEAIARAVASHPGGIGYVRLSQMQGVRALEVSDGADTPAVAPSVFAVASEDYILSRRMYLYAPPGVPEMGRRFVEFVEGPEGQAAAVRSGFVGLGSAWESIRAPATAPAEYRSMTEGKKRNRITFRFEAGFTDQLDSKGEADLDRVVADLRQRGVKQVTLLGFSDSRGTFAESLELSRKRARAVGERLARLGLRYEASGFSSLMPVALNQTPDGSWSLEGTWRNRRVELWAAF